MKTDKSTLSRLPLQSLRHLEAVVRLGSFEAAARELSVTPGAVSQQIRRLEDRLEVALFQRLGNRSKANHIAVELAKALQAAFLMIEEAIETNIGHKERSSVQIHLYQTWANRWLIPRIETFAQSHPDISVEFETGVVLPQSDYDLALSMSLEIPSDTEKSPLFTPHLCPVCTPAMADRIQTAEDILSLPRIASSNRLDDWGTWLKAANLSSDERKPIMVFPNSTLVYEAALSGAGVAIAQLELVLADLESGRLVRPSSIVTNHIHPINLVRRTGFRVSPAIAQFTDWLTKEATVLRDRTEAYLRQSHSDLK
ncbi:MULTISPECIES: LysR substrate-binding domain-containing protein [Marinomonas]|uniref:LysR substrate-binding domain-containing protein n=1 Tax=Marinomonas rhodophyticola TaxID=2992803 RepID=A0ABT3KJ41_9GAMM|nr:LysR substrate-binding domain-containing protein [Marinomonas sp. KJ51-3]MCW4630579.1 LysR substrate-binding domain-containing protein [Marinomonas sp. KJ51-3]